MDRHIRAQDLRLTNSATYSGEHKYCLHVDGSDSVEVRYVKEEGQDSVFFETRNFQRA